jgi:hypothetical protein
VFSFILKIKIIRLPFCHTHRHFVSLHHTEASHEILIHEHEFELRPQNAKCGYSRHFEGMYVLLTDGSQKTSSALPVNAVSVNNRCMLWESQEIHKCAVWVTVNTNAEVCCQLLKGFGDR